jgi:branched-subunit amino acid aminotransferase/4-amino-4-deoxychorismate lyase
MPLDAAFGGDPFLLARLPDVHEAGQESHSPIRVYVDKEPTSPSLFTTTKTTARRVYEEARQRNGLSALTTPSGRSQEVLLQDHAGLITETSIFNIACKRGGRWITPSSASGCLPGVARRWLVENGRIVEDAECALTVANIKTGELVLLFNGLQGCRLGVIHDEV